MSIFPQCRSISGSRCGKSAFMLKEVFGNSAYPLSQEPRPDCLLKSSNYTIRRKHCLFWFGVQSLSLEFNRQWIRACIRHAVSLSCLHPGGPFPCRLTMKNRNSGLTSSRCAHERIYRPSRRSRPHNDGHSWSRKCISRAESGMTIAATYPAAVISMSLLRLLKGSLLEENMARTIGSIGESVAAGAVFTIPASSCRALAGDGLDKYWESVALM